MKNRILLYFVIIYWLSVQICCDNIDNTDDDDIFIPTHEWKTIKKGQKVPKGLHIRINLETGLKEGKLMDERQDSRSYSLSIVKEETTEKVDSDKRLNPEELKRQLKKVIKPEKSSDKEDILDNDINKKFRTVEELKKDMDELNLSPRTDSEIMKELFEEYQEEIKNKEIIDDNLLRIISDFDYLAHQYDNALDFLKYDGFKKIIFKNLNSTNSLIKTESLKLFSSLVQNNPKVKVHALEVGSIPILLRLLSLDPTEEVKIRAVTALSCLLRTFPYAQINFIENGGLSIFSELFELDYPKIHVKLVTIIGDLLTERKNDKENFKLFKKLNLENMLVKLNWCENLTDLLNILLYSNPDDHDSIEKCLLTMYSMPEQCVEFYDSEVLESLQIQYQILAESDSENDYYENLAELCDLLLNKLEKNNFKIKTELYLWFLISCHLVSPTWIFCWYLCGYPYTGCFKKT